METLIASGLPGCVCGGSCVLRESVGRRGSRPYRLLCDLGRRRAKSAAARRRVVRDEVSTG
jgi:hypothetical protein